MKAINPFKFGKEVGGYQFYDRLADPFLGRYLLQPAAKVFA